MNATERTLQHYTHYKEDHTEHNYKSCKENSGTVNARKKASFYVIRRQERFCTLYSFHGRSQDINVTQKTAAATFHIQRRSQNVHVRVFGYNLEYTSHSINNHQLHNKNNTKASIFCLIFHDVVSGEIRENLNYAFSLKRKHYI